MGLLETDGSNNQRKGAMNHAEVEGSGGFPVA